MKTLREVFVNERRELLIAIELASYKTSASGAFLYR